MLDHLDKLKAFKTVADSGSMRKAASLMHLTQPALTRSVHILELHAGGELFIRSKNGVELTDLGKKLLITANSIFREVDQFNASAKTQKITDLGILKVGTYEYLVNVVWSYVFKKISERFGEFKIELNTGHAFFPHHETLQKNVDITLDIEPMRHDGVKSERIFKDTFNFYISSKLKSKRDPDLGDLPIIIVSDAIDSNRIYLSEWLHILKLNFLKTIEVKTFESAYRLAESGLGIAILPMSIVKTMGSRSELKILQLKNVKLTGFGDHYICATYLKRDENRFKIKILCQLLKESIRESNL